MSITSRKLAVAVASVALGFGVMEAKSAQAATFTGPNTWNLSFFDNGEQVGSGQFSFEREPFEGTFPENPPPPPTRRFDPISIDASDNFHSLTSFSATIGELSWELSDRDRQGFLFFVPPEDNALPQPPAGLRRVTFGDPRFPSLLLTNSWYFQSIPSLLVGDQLIIDNDGSFNQIAPPDFSYDGTWEAEPVPEPSTIAGTLLAGSALGAWTRRKRKAQQERTKEPLA